MNYHVLLDIFDEEDKKEIFQVTLHGKPISFNCYMYKMKFEFDNSALFLDLVFLHYLSILIYSIITECIINSMMIIEYLVFSSSFFFMLVN